MVDVAKVSMFGITVGMFRWDERYEVARFEYDRSFVGRGLEPSPLMMPVLEGPRSDVWGHLSLSLCLMPATIHVGVLRLNRW